MKQIISICLLIFFVLSTSLAYCESGSEIVLTPNTAKTADSDNSTKEQNPQILLTPPKKSVASNSNNTASDKSIGQEIEKASFWLCQANVVGCVVGAGYYAVSGVGWLIKKIISRDKEDSNTVESSTEKVE